MAFGLTANGDRFALFQILTPPLASTVIVLLLIALTWRRAAVAPRPAHPWSGLPLTLNPRDHRFAADPRLRA